MSSKRAAMALSAVLLLLTPGLGAGGARAADVSSGRIKLQTPRRCDSEASRVSISVQNASVMELVNVLTAVSQFEIHVVPDVSAVRCVVEIADAPWDCVLRDVAKRLDLEIEREGRTIRLVSRRGR